MGRGFDGSEAEPVDRDPEGVKTLPDGADVPVPALTADITLVGSDGALVPVDNDGADALPTMLVVPFPGLVPLAAHTPRGPELCGGAPARVVFVQYCSVQLLLGSYDVKIWLP